MKAHQAEYQIATQCRVLGVSTSGYYAWLKRAPSARSKANAELLEEIKKSHKKSDGTYGAPRIHADLPKEMGASLNRVARVMCDVGRSSPDLCVKAEEAPRLRLGCLGDLLFLEE